MEMTEFRKNPAKSEDLDLKELKILVDNMFQEILQSYIVHERHCTKEILLINEECKILKNQTERYKAELQNKKKTIINDESKVDSSEVKNADVNQLKEFMLNSQEAMEMERTKLLLRCNIAETEVTELHNYINLLKSRGDSR
ncbi:hypothetical protein HK099_008698 [Clydaea vesicula]|uniref:Uncharacterized protein n=1 Tax=Clydaea vesicula TaxID=447962 RepID=A0AAD5U618_9FUNG|nr:hypothetical protein HK099_008698 [Clydaea vesicula]